MIIGIIFLLGLTTGLVAGFLIHNIFILYGDLNSKKKFNERQERYRKMI